MVFNGIKEANFLKKGRNFNWGRNLKKVVVGPCFGKKLLGTFKEF